jgi:hypothetical protein
MPDKHTRDSFSCKALSLAHEPRRRFSGKAHRGPATPDGAASGEKEMVVVVRARSTASSRKGSSRMRQRRRGGGGGIGARNAPAVAP